MPDASQYPDSIGKINPEQSAGKIAYSEYLRAPQDRFEGWRYAMAQCRKCGDEVRVCVQWAADGVEVCSSGTKPGCENSKCGDNMPCQILRMALPPAESRQGFRSVGDILKGAGLL